MSFGGRSRKRSQGDLSGVVIAAGGTYLGVQLVGPFGEGWDAEREADKLREATKGTGVSLYLWSSADERMGS